MPNKDLTKVKPTVRRFHLRQRPVLDSCDKADDQKCLLEPYIATNEARKIKKTGGGKAIAAAEETLFKPIKGLTAAEAFGDDAVAELGLEEAGERQKKGVQKKFLSKKDDTYVVGAGYDSDEEELNSEDESYFPNDGYDYNSHLRQMDERQVFRGNEMQIDCKSTVQYLDGMRAPVEELRKLRNELEGGQALGRKSADIIQKIQISDRGNVVDPEAEASDLKGAKAKMVVFRDGLDSREVLAQNEDPAYADAREALSALDALNEVDTAIEAGYEELVPAAGEWDAWDNFVDLAGGVDEDAELDTNWGAGADWARIAKAERDAKRRAKLRAEFLAGGGGGAVPEQRRVHFGGLHDGSSPDSLNQAGWWSDEEEEEEDDAVSDAEVEKLMDELDGLRLGERAKAANLEEYRLAKMLEEYEEEEVGQLEPETVAGDKSLAVFDSVMDEYLADRKAQKKFWAEELLPLKVGGGAGVEEKEACESNDGESSDGDSNDEFATPTKNSPAEDAVPITGKKRTAYIKPTKEEILRQVERQDMSPEFDEDAEIDRDVYDAKLLKLMGIECKEKEKWDCETILSTQSNLSNHPGRIEVSSRRKKRAIVRSGETDALGAILEGDDESGSDEEGSEAPSDAEDSEGDVLIEAPVGPRPKNETKEEKKARKNAVKAARKQCREMKKANTKLFKEEAVKAKKLKMQGGVADVKQGVRLFAL